MKPGFRISDCEVIANTVKVHVDANALECGTAQVCGPIPYKHHTAARILVLAKCADGTPRIFAGCRALTFGDARSERVMCLGTYDEGPTQQCAECGGDIESSYGDPDARACGPRARPLE